MIKINVPYISQKGRYPTGCESVSTVMLLQLLGYEISVDEFIENYLDCHGFEMRDGQLYGPDPNEHFCGSPFNEDDFGCYAPVICKALENVFRRCAPKLSGENGGSDMAYKAVDETGAPIHELLERYIDKGMPVIFWACIDMREPIVGPEWKLLDTGEIFTWISNEHCMLLVGYDDDGYYFNDPYEDHGVVYYPKQLVEERHRAQYGMAVGVCRNRSIIDK
ncbi:C39 family peptidase [Frisingicoccus caecimuris]|uniref:Uncharacterized protein YvpB n=1 Tax=Frisingicoccus caecimuris TaxID=1796636 RepID=A0A4R2LCH7_9FIRM|nr:C39 family peptidase [Frisingicoccus caecimuris]MCR1917713.1 C39 family peptidase [Frisingicoccus caecimuris]TCO85987.1 uncharacterized protein YvpB [Frisingicoccus caecimuris]